MTASPLLDKDGKPLRLVASDLDTAEHDSNLRATMKGVLDLLSLTDPNADKRVQAIVTPRHVAGDGKTHPSCSNSQTTEKEGKVRRALAEAIALMQLKDEKPEVQIAAAKALGDMGSISEPRFPHPAHHG
ncbi:MAG: HEAT repeat domain-containing protein [Chthoniobacter sp.]